MNKGPGMIVGVVVVIFLIVVFWALRGRPAGDQTGPLVTSPVTTLMPLEPAQTPVTGDLPGTTLPTATPAQTGGLVSISAAGFSPGSVTIPVGRSVTFTNTDTESHQIASNPHPVHTNFPSLNIAVLAPAASDTVTFDRAGTFGYHNHLNPGLTGIVLVQ
jgi:plastocyanin